MIYHIIFPVNYKKKILTQEIELSLVEICSEIEKRYEIAFIEIGVDKESFHFVIESIPTMSVEKIVKTIKTIVSREIFKTYKDLKTDLWGGSFFTTEYYSNTLGKDEVTEYIKMYFESQGQNIENEYKVLFKG